MKDSLNLRWAPDAGINGKLIKKSIFLKAPYVLNGPPMLEIIIFYMLSNGARRWVSNGVSGAPGVGRGTVLAPPRPAMPELLAGARFWGHRGRKRWQGYGFGTSMAANVGRGTVMGIWFCTHTQTCRQVLLKHAKQTGGYRKARGKDKHTHQFVPVYALTGSWALSCNRACS